MRNYMCRYFLHSALHSKIMRSHISAKLVNHFSYSSCMYQTFLSAILFQEALVSFILTSLLNIKEKQIDTLSLKRSLKMSFLCMG
jgi:hypothetical protein